jgi:adenine-specific DNA-methyltransferase
VRVTGPFTVESLSLHRTIADDEPRPVMETTGIAHDAGSFEATILDNLRKAGVQNTVANGRLNFDRLEPFAGTPTRRG